MAFFTEEKSLEVRGAELLHEGLLLSIRSPVTDYLQCLYDEYKNSSLNEQVTQYLTANNTMENYPFHPAAFGISIDGDAYEAFGDSFMLYQGERWRNVIIVVLSIM